MTEYLTTSAIGERIGVKPATVSAYIKKGMLPEPDAVMVGAGGAILTSGWLSETIDTWHANRPGKGGRKAQKQE